MCHPLVQQVKVRCEQTHRMRKVEVAVDVHGGPGEHGGARSEACLHGRQMRLQQGARHFRQALHHSLMLLQAPCQPQLSQVYILRDVLWLHSPTATEGNSVHRSLQACSSQLLDMS